MDAPSARFDRDEEALEAICRDHDVRELALFGSVLHAGFRPDSDIDVLVEFEPGARVGIFEFVGLRDELATLLGREVDLVSKSGLHELTRQHVLDSAETIYTADSGFQAPSLTEAQRWPAPTLNRDLLRLQIANQASEGIAELITGIEPATIESDDLRKSATLYEIHRLGVALSRLSPDVTAQHPDAPWQSVIDTGLRAVEDYRNLTWDDVWEVVSASVPVVHERIRHILATDRQASQ